VVAFGAIFFNIVLPRRTGVPSLGWRSTFLAACVAWGVLLTGLTELLGVLKAFDLPGVAAAWAASSAGLALAFAVRWRALPPPRWPPVPRVEGSVCAVVIALGALAAALATIAILAPPNTWDSMTYHMARVEHWIQNRTPGFYPTHSQRQLLMPPWAEYAIAHLQILSGGDRFASLVQWFAFLGSAAGVSLVAAHLGTGSGGQALSAVYCATLPGAILQATSTQTDLVTAFWLVVAVVFGFRCSRVPEPWAALAAGAALGLAVLTKPTAYFYGFPFAVWFIASCIRRHQRRGLAACSLAAAAALVLNLAVYARTLDLFGTPLGPGWPAEFRRPPTVSQGDGNFALKLAAKAAENLCLQLGTPVKALNDRVLGAVRTLDRVRHASIDAAPDGMRIDASPHEDFAGNAVHVALGALLVALGCLGALPSSAKTRLYLLALASGYLLFVYYVPFLPWNTRLQLPLLVLFAALCGPLLERPSLRVVRSVLVATLLALCLPWVLWNRSRRLVGKNNVFQLDRTTQYFRNDPAREAGFRAMARFIGENRCRTVGILATGDTWEYPLWILTRAEGRDLVRFYHHAVGNVSSTLPPEVRPGAGVCLCNVDLGSCRLMGPDGS
jgi:hypothetical protein